MVPDSTIAEIKARLNIIDVVSEYVPLKRAGQTFLGLCPFHKEKTPSFNVHPARQCFHCFGCHKGGDLFTFVAAMDGLTFPEVLQKLAARAGVQLQPDQNSRQNSRLDRPESRGSQKAMDALNWANKFYHYVLTQKPEGRVGLDYLHERGISQKAIDRFRIGVSPSGWSGLRDQMVRRGYSLDILQEAGLIRCKEETRKTYDWFRGRLMFPITDREGQTIGFGARRLNGAQNEATNDDRHEPKYLNSPDSPIFSKRKTLYGIYENTRGVRLRGEAIIVEGYMDVVGLWEKGVDNALAVMGTALTEEHCVQIKSLTNRVVTVFDSDPAGEGAWRHSIALFMEAGILARDVTLPQGQDPDDFAKAQGAEAFYLLCDKSPRQVTKWLKLVASRGRLSEKETTELLEGLAPLLKATRKLADRATLWDDIGLVLNVSRQALRDISETGYGAESVKGRNVRTPPPSRAPMAVPGKRMDPCDKQFLASAIEHRQQFTKTRLEDWIDGIRESKTREILKELYRATGDGVAYLQSILAGCPAGDELGSLVSKYLMGESGDSQAGAVSLAEAMGPLQRRVHQGVIERLSVQAKLAQRIGNEVESLALLSQIRELRARLLPEIPVSMGPELSPKSS